MSWEKFEDDCPGCRPALLDITTGKQVPETDPVMTKINEVWDKTNQAERQAYHRVMCQNSRADVDLILTQDIVNKIQLACQEMIS